MHVPQTIPRWHESLINANFLVVVIGTLGFQNATATLLFHDGFDYTAGEELGAAGSSSRPPWENDKSQLTIAGGSLDYAGLRASTGNRVNVDATSPTLDSTRTAADAWVSQTSGSLYCSFLLRVQSMNGINTTGDGTSVVTISRTSNNTQLIGINLLNSGGIKVGVLKYPSSSSPVSSSAFFSSGTGASLSADGSTTYLVVAKYEWVDGGANDVVTVWVNPGNLGAAEDTGNKVSTSAGTDGTDSAGRATFSRGPNVNIDELRIGQTWADVTPTGGSADPEQPHITESFVSSEGFVLRGTNGTPDGVYQVLNSTNLLAPAVTWPVVSTNSFDGLGNFDSTNPIPPSASQTYYRLLEGGELPAAPSISTQPQDQTVIIGQNALFSVTATGTAPLFYQWRFNGTLLSGANGTTHTVTSAQTNDAGGYTVVVTNSVGSITSSVATLSVAPSPTSGTPDTYATVGSGTTGGAGGPTVTVNNLTDFEFYADNSTGPYIVLVQGTINLGSSNVRVRDNKTIIGVGNNATLVGDLKVFRNNNVIIQNITFTNPGGVGDGDGLTLQLCENIWVDHCTFVDCDDGSLDITHAADWVTVSWCHFYYTNPANDHRFSNLVGHSDSNAGEDAGKLHVTFHHNWWGQLVHERMPRVRFGRVHCFNNYYNSPGNNYCVRVALECEVLMENNYFKDVDEPWQYFTDTGQTPGKVREQGTNEYVNVTGYFPATDTLTAEANGLNPPPYSYTLDVAAGIPNSVTNNAGAGKGPFAP